MTKKRGLGSKRGLDALMGSIKVERQFATGVMRAGQTGHDSDVTKTDTKQPALLNISLNCLQSGKYQPRSDFKEETLSELADSIRQHGVMQPIVIRPLSIEEQKDGITHEIIAGERRWRAAKLAGLESIVAIERTLDDDVAIALALIENIQREDLTVLEQAAALYRFHTEFGMSHAMIADVVGKARATVSNLLRLNQLHDDVKELMRQGLLDMGHARALLTLSNQQQPIIAKKIAQQNMTVRDAEKLVKNIVNPPPSKPTQANHELSALTQTLCDTLGTTVKLKQSKDGKGSIEIVFHSHDELCELLAQLGIEI